jgi:hypothetical protein
VGRSVHREEGVNSKRSLPISERIDAALDAHARRLTIVKAMFATMFNSLVIEQLRLREGSVPSIDRRAVTGAETAVRWTEETVRAV